MFPLYIISTIFTNTFWLLTNAVVLLLSYTQQTIGLPLLTLTSSFSYDVVTSRLLASQSPALRGKITDVVAFSLDFAALVLCATGVYLMQPKMRILLPRALKASMSQVGAVSFLNVWGGLYVAYRMVEQYTPVALVGAATRTAFLMHVAHASLYLFALVYSFGRIPYGGLACVCVLLLKCSSSFFAVVADLVEPVTMVGPNDASNRDGLAEFWCQNAFVVWMYVAGVFWEMAYVAWMVAVESRTRGGMRSKM